MNRIQPDTPRAQVLDLLRRDGYVLMENALTGAPLQRISEAYDRQLALTAVSPYVKRVEIKRILERDPAFEALMDLPATFPIAYDLIGADIELASSGELDHKFANAPAHIGWHNDFQWMTNVTYPRQNFWVRCTYFLGDVTEDMGPFTLLPGSHLADHSCPQDWWDEKRQPRFIEGQVAITGPKGSCLINNTEIWHTNTPNRSTRDRRLIMLLYKHAWMKQWQEGYETTAEFAARQATPLRQQLTGNYVWHHGEKHFAAYDWYQAYAR